MNSISTLYVTPTETLYCEESQYKKLAYKKNKVLI